MTLDELALILQATGFPVAYSHFVQTESTPLPEPPFICYLTNYSAHVHADDMVYKSNENVQIELYTNKKDLAAEAKLEALLNENELPYYETETFIDSEQLFQKIYEVRLL